MKKAICSVLFLTLILATLTGCGSSAGAKNAISTDGSTSMEKVIGALGEKYQIENYLEGIETLLAKLGEER